MLTFEQLSAGVQERDGGAYRAARLRHDTLTKPVGSLGRLEELAAVLAGISGICPPPVPQRPALAVFAADHGVHAAGVTPWPQSVTAQMVASICSGGAAASVLAGSVGAELLVVDVGVASELDVHPRLLERRIRAGSRDLSREPALEVAELEAALDVGAEVAQLLVDLDGADLLVTGEMGIANSTPAAAVIAALTGTDPVSVTGRGTGIDDDTLRLKTRIVAGAVAGLPPGSGPREVLAAVGGLELAALTGFVVAGAALGVPVVVDGVISQAALLAAAGLVPAVTDRVIVGHRSTEPGSEAVLDALGLEPVLDLGMRLGEGTGALLAVPVVRAAAALLGEMSTFGEARVDQIEP